MKYTVWNILVFTVLTLTVGSFLVFFRENKVEPTIAHVPYVFWTGFLVTVLIVVLTFLASRFFPHQESEKQ